MKDIKRISAEQNCRWNQMGSVLIYVLWILVIVSVLAFKLGASSNVMTLKNSSLNNQLKRQLQIESAIQFAIYKIIANQWNDEILHINLNNYPINLEIYNEAGFLSLYQLNDESLNKLSDRLEVDLEDLKPLIKSLRNDQDIQKFNSIDELDEYLSENKLVVEAIKPFISIYHEEPTNPMFAPIKVLTMLPGIDLYRVEKLANLRDTAEKAFLREDINDQLNITNFDYTDDISPYYRIRVSLGNYFYRIFVKFDKRSNEYMVLTIEPVEKPNDLFET